MKYFVPAICLLGCLVAVCAVFADKVIQEDEEYHDVLGHCAPVTPANRIIDCTDVGCVNLVGTPPYESGHRTEIQYEVCTTHQNQSLRCRQYISPQDQLCAVLRLFDSPDCENEPLVYQDIFVGECSDLL